jgi:hypothetical protein
VSASRLNSRAAGPRKSGYTTTANADIYETLLKEEIFAGIRGRQVN